MELDDLVMKAKKNNRALSRVLKKTAKYRSKYAAKCPREACIIKDIEGDFVALTWEAVIRYNPEKYMTKFVTLLLTIFNRYVAREWIRYKRRLRKLVMYRVNRWDVASKVGRKSLTSNVSLRVGVKDLLQKTLRGVEKIVFVRTIIGCEKANVVAKEIGVPIKRIYLAKKNIRLLVEYYVNGRNIVVLDLLGRTIYVRGLCDELDGIPKLFTKGGKVEQDNSLSVLGVLGF